MRIKAHIIVDDFIFIAVYVYLYHGAVPGTYVVHPHNPTNKIHNSNEILACIIYNISA
jgi:hypothetical protein